MIKKLWQHLSKRRKRQFFMLLILMITASVLEVVSIGAVVPFLGALAAPEQIYQHHLSQPLIQILEITGPDQLLFPLTVIFIVSILIAAIVRLFLLYALTRLSFATGADISVDIYRRTLYQNYSIHMSRNTSEIINSIITKTNIVIGHVLTPILTFISSVIVILVITSMIFVINSQVALTIFSIFTLFYFIIARLTKKSLQNNSQTIANQSTQMVKSLQEGLGGIRDVLINGTQEFYCKLYRNSDLLMRRATGDNVYYRMIEEGEIDPEINKIIYESEPIPGSPIAVRGDLPESIKLAIQNALLNMNEQTIHKVDGWGGISNYQKVTDSDYDVIRTTAKLLGMDVTSPEAANK
mgnify:CR=1 FL=1